MNVRLVCVRLSSERHGAKNVAKPVREDDGGLPALTEYSALRFSALCGGLTLLAMNPYSALTDWFDASCVDLVDLIGVVLCSS